MSMLLDSKHGVNPSVLVCFLCGESDSLMLCGRIPGGGKAPHEMTHYTVKGHPGQEDTKHTHVCQTCRDSMDKCIMLIETTDELAECNRTRTGRIFGISEEACARIFTGVDFSKRAAFVPKSVIEAIGIDKIDPTYPDGKIPDNTRTKKESSDSNL